MMLNYTLLWKLLVVSLAMFHVMLAKSIDVRSLLNINKELEMMERPGLENRNEDEVKTDLNDDEATVIKQLYNRQIWKLMQESTKPSILNDDSNDFDYDDTLSEELSKLSENPKEEVVWEEPTFKWRDCWLVAMHGGTIASYSPSCNIHGGYTAKQCYLERCWCVNRIGQPMKKIYGENGEISWKFLEWTDGVDSGIDDSYFTYGYKAIKLDCESLLDEYKLYYLTNLQRKIKAILSSANNSSGRILPILSANEHQPPYVDLEKEPPRVTPRPKIQNNSPKSSPYSVTYNGTFIGNINSESESEAQVTNLKRESSVYDEKPSSDTFRKHDQNYDTTYAISHSNAGLHTDLLVMNLAQTDRNSTEDLRENNIMNEIQSNKVMNNNHSLHIELVTDVSNYSNVMSEDNIN